MLSVIALHEVAGSDARLHEALRAADLPTDDIEDDGRTFFEAVSGDGQTIGYAGLERCAGDYLLRSVDFHAELSRFFHREVSHL